MIVIQIIKEIFAEFPLLIIPSILFLIVIFINSITKFFKNVQELYHLIKSFMIFSWYKFKFIFKWFIKIIFFPITIYKVIKKYRYFNSKIVNNSVYKEMDYI